MDEIVNKVAKSNIEVIDLTEYYPQEPFTVIDISQWMFKGLVIKEKEFRNFLKNHDWQQYQNHYVGVTCTTDAIVSIWAYLLVSTYLQPYVKKVVFGTKKELEISVWETIIGHFPIKKYENKRVIIKGCSKKSVPINAYLLLVNILKTNVKSILFGEICSAVPIYKKGKM